MRGLPSAAKGAGIAVLALASACPPALHAVRGTGSTTAVQRVWQAAERAPGGAMPLDINTASAEELRLLPGMGVAYARRVIEGRPYTAKNQLLTRGVLPAAAYEGIRDRVVAHRPKVQP